MGATKDTAKPMTRQDAYAYIKSKNLGSKIYSKYNKPYSSLSTDVLLSFIQEQAKKKQESAIKEEKKQEEKKPEKPVMSFEARVDRGNRLIRLIKGLDGEIKELESDISRISRPNTVLCISDRHLKVRNKSDNREAHYYFGERNCDETYIGIKTYKSNNDGYNGVLKVTDDICDVNAVKAYYIEILKSKLADKKEKIESYKTEFNDL